MDKVVKSIEAPFSDKELAIFKQYMLKNIATEKNVFNKRAEGKKITSIPGAIIAAPLEQGLNFTQDYVFRWVRDGAITMQAILALYRRATTPAEKEELRPYLINYVNFARLCYSQPPLNSIDIHGEPKFNIDGTLWTGAWGRPQNDGPAFAVIAMMQLYGIFLQEGADQALLDTLYHQSSPSLIKTNLEYICSHWSEASFGAWEEVRGSHFLRSCVHRRALYEGAEFARQLGDTGAAKYYIDQAKALEAFMMKYWSEDVGYFRESIDESDSRGGGLDVTTIMGFVYGRMSTAGDAFPVLHNRTLSTAYFVRNAFENLYQVNLKIKETSGNGPLMGRYPDDRYDGDQNLYGNPWFLATHNFAEFYYILATALIRAEKYELRFMSIQFFKQIMPEIALEEHQLLNIEHNRELFDKVIAGLIQAGDRMLLAVKSLTATYLDGSILHMSEQIDRRSGQQRSAMDLTWSYASAISAALAREEIMGLWQKLGS